MIQPRRLVPQLTSLLDLLLIVIFAQYMDVEETSGQMVQAANLSAQSAQAEAEEHIAAERTERERAERERDAAMRTHEIAVGERDAAARERDAAWQERDAAAQERDAAQREHGATVETLEDTRRELTTVRTKLASTQAEVQQLHQQLTREQGLTQQVKLQAAADRGRIAHLASQMLQVPEAVFLQALTTVPKERQAELLRQFKALRDKTPAALVRHLLTVDELKKRTDIWEIFLNKDDLVNIKRNSKLVVETLYFPKAAEFQAALARRVKTMEEPKVLVLFAFTWSRESTAAMEDEIRIGIHGACGELAGHYRTKRFELADLGHPQE